MIKNIKTRHDVLRWLLNNKGVGGATEIANGVGLSEPTTRKILREHEEDGSIKKRRSLFFITENGKEASKHMDAIEELAEKNNE